MDKILVADDTPCVLSSAVDFFEDRFETFGAETRAKALAIIGREGKELKCIVTDLKMPDKADGEAVAQTGIDMNIPVIILTSSPEEISAEIAEQCLAVLNKRKASSIIDVKNLIEGIE